MSLFETYKNHETEKIIFLFTFLMSLIFWSLARGVPSDSVVINAKNNKVEATSIYEVYFSIAQEIPPNALIIVTFPKGFNLSGVLIAGSTTFNGGFKVTVNDSKVIMKRSGLGRTIKPFEKVDVKFANIRNPIIPADNYKIEIKIKNEKEITIIEKVETIKIVPLSQK